MKNSKHDNVRVRFVFLKDASASIFFLGRKKQVDQLGNECYSLDSVKLVCQKTTEVLMKTGIEGSHQSMAIRLSVESAKLHLASGEIFQEKLQRIC